MEYIGYVACPISCVGWDGLLLLGLGIGWEGYCGQGKANLDACICVGGISCMGGYVMVCWGLPNVVFIHPCFQKRLSGGGAIHVFDGKKHGWEVYCMEGLVQYE